MVIPLGRPSPGASRDQPGRLRENPLITRGYPVICRPYSVLLPVGFTMPFPLPATRCALTAPFHPCRSMTCTGRRFAFCGTVPGVAPAGRYPAPCFRGARTFLPPGVAARRATIRPSGERLVVRRRAGVNLAALLLVHLDAGAPGARLDALEMQLDA